MRHPTDARLSQHRNRPASPGCIRVLIVDDHAIVRKGLCALLNTEPDIEVVGEACDGQEALAETERLRPDIVLMDLVMPGMDGLEATQRITDDLPDVRVLVLTSFSGDDKVFPAIRAGARGYLLKDTRPEELVQAIQRLHHGRPSLDPSIAHRLPGEPGPDGHPPSDAPPLTGRELEVLQLIARGQTNRQIADLLAISDATVRTHVSRILAKLGLNSRTQAALYALRQGIASLHD